MKKTTLGILLMFVCTLFTALGQLFFKYGSEKFSWNILSLLTNVPLLIGFFFYGLGALLLIVALKFGKLSLIYPFVSLTFIWVMFISVFVFKEVLNSFKICALFFIVLGIVFIAGSETHG